MPTVDSTLKTINIASNILFGVIGFKQRKAYERILLAASLSYCLVSINDCVLVPFAILHADSVCCPLAGLLNVLFYSIAEMLSAVNMVHRYMSLYCSVLCHKLFNARGVMVWCLITVFINTVWLCLLLLLNVFGMDAVGSCLFKAINGQNSPWTIPSMAISLGHSFLTMCCGYFVIRKIRHHSTQNASNLQSKLISESKQIMILMTILMLLSLITILIGSVARYLPSNTLLMLWSSRVLLFISPSYTAFVPIVTMAVIKDYRKTVVIFFKRSNRVTPVEPIHIIWMNSND